jgi:DNA-binding CsgD family transcriptional regulator
MPTRKERARQAADLRANGLRLVDIASRMGLSVSYTWALLDDPDGSADRERKRSYGGKCEDCGGPTDGSNGRSKAPKRCARCNAARTGSIVRTRADARKAEVLALRRQGLLNKEIADRIGDSVEAVGSLVYRMKRDGINVGPSPYRQRGRAA